MISFGMPCQQKRIVYDLIKAILVGGRMGIAAKEREWGDKARRFLKAELKRAGMTYAELARRLNAHGFEGETVASVNSKLVRGSFAVSFFLGCLAVLELEGVRLEDL